MNFSQVTAWVEAHPTESIVIGGGAAIAILYFLGYIGGGSASASSSGASNLASAYYAAEAQQAVVGGQIQEANIAATASTAQAGIQANAATAIAKTQSRAATTINGQNASAATTINQSSNDLMAQQSSDQLSAILGTSSNQLLATQSNNYYAYQTAATNDATASTINQSNNDTLKYNNFINNVVVPEFAYGGGYGNIVAPGVGQVYANVGSASINAAPHAALVAAGYSPAEIASMDAANFGIAS